MKNICLIFQVHLTPLLNRYRFFDIGDHHEYVDESATKNLLTTFAKNCYLPANNLLLRQIRSSKGRIKVAFYLSGTIAELLKIYDRETYDSFRELASTGYVEFLTGTYSCSFSSKWNPDAFRRQIEDHRKSMEILTGLKPVRIFFNTDLIYDDEVGALLEESSLHGIITDGDKLVLGWKSPDLLYANSLFPSQKIFFRNPALSKEIADHFYKVNRAEKSLSTQKFLSDLLSGTEDRSQINLVFPYEIFGHPGNLRFMDHFLYLSANSSGMEWGLPSDSANSATETTLIRVPRTISMDEGISFLPGETENELPMEALSKLYALTPKIMTVSDAETLKDWNFLQDSGHFRLMTTSGLHRSHPDPQNPYGTPFDAFINYMNILNDFKIKLDQPSKK